MAFAVLVALALRDVAGLDCNADRLRLSVWAGHIVTGRVRSALSLLV
jgi:hypothetical protein